MRRSSTRSSPTRSLDAACAGDRGRSRWTSPRTRSSIEKGFSPELGARPLKRAVEHHLLAPLAAAIVEQSVPDGDQFLFVTAPAASASRSPSSTRTPSRRSTGDEEPAARSSYPHLAPLAARATSASVRFVLAELERVADAVESAQTTEGPRAVGHLRARLLGARRTASSFSPRPSTSTGCRPRIQNGRAARRQARAAASRPTAAQTPSSSACSPGVCTSSTGRSPGSRTRLRPRFSCTDRPVRNRAQPTARDEDVRVDPHGDVRRLGGSLRHARDASRRARRRAPPRRLRPRLRRDPPSRVRAARPRARGRGARWQPASSIEIRFCVVVVARRPQAAGASDDVVRAPVPRSRQPRRPSVVVRRYRPGRRRSCATPCAATGRRLERVLAATSTVLAGASTSSRAVSSGRSTTARLPSPPALALARLPSPLRPSPASPPGPSATQRPSHSRRSSSIASRSPWIRSERSRSPTTPSQRPTAKRENARL